MRSAARILAGGVALHCAGFVFAQGGAGPTVDRSARGVEAIQVSAVSPDRQVFPVRRGEVVVTPLVAPPGAEPDQGSGGRTGLMLLVTLVLIARVVSRRV
jgi:hypothetical protein